MRLIGLCSAILMLLSGCGGSGAAIDPCGPWRPITIGQGDALTDATARQVLAHNLTGRRLCGW